MDRYRRIETTSADELANAVPGGRFRLSPLTRAPFFGGHGYLLLDGMVLNRVSLGQASVAVGGERDRNSTVCSVIGPCATMNGREVARSELTLVHPGDPFTLRTAAAATLYSFALESEIVADCPELDLPFGFAGERRPGRWKVASDAATWRFMRLLDEIFASLGEQLSVIETSATRTSLRNAALRAIAAFADDGAFVPDVSTARRHTQIMSRFERALEELEPESLDIVALCRATGTSRRSLEAIVRARTGNSPWNYLRWRRLLRARELLRVPDPTTRVTGVAFDLGIWHLGRFSAEYASAFGETPAETLRKARGATSSSLEGPHFRPHH